MANLYEAPFSDVLIMYLSKKFMGDTTKTFFACFPWKLKNAFLSTKKRRKYNMGTDEQVKQICTNSKSRQNTKLDN